MILEKYSFGIGDRFGHEGVAQLQAIKYAQQDNLTIIPVWNKSFREHTIIGSKPIQTRQEADYAVKKLQWHNDYYVDADHITLETVSEFIPSSNFFTLDVANKIGVSADEHLITDFIRANSKYIGNLKIPGIDNAFLVTKELLIVIANQFLAAIQEAKRIYQVIAQKKGAANFITEVSMDEVEKPQSPLELFFILSAIAFFEIPAQTIAPRFSGRFNKGVDYIGDLEQFTSEFAEDLLVVDFAIKEFNLPVNLKLSIHSGSDKFSIYPIIGKLIKKYNSGIHIKTAGTTWLEELIGLSLSGHESLRLVKDIYAQSYERQKELCAPYKEVISINTAQLPTPKTVYDWDGKKFANSLRHIPEHQDYDPNLRQLLHVGYKIAAEFGNSFTDALKKHHSIIANEVTTNIYERHIKRLMPSNF